jgi:Flp pilus assembly protein TadD
MQLIKPDSNNLSPSYSLLSKDYCVKGILMADEGNLKGALENFNKAIESNPNNHVAYFNRATIKIDLGDIDGARNDFFNFDRLKINALGNLRRE